MILDYTPDLYGDIIELMDDYYQTGYTVCGAQDPAVIYLSDTFRLKHPALAEFTVCRVVDKYLNAWNSATELHFSNKELTKKERDLFEEVLDEETAE